jgi:hypothetical protein
MAADSVKEWTLYWYDKLQIEAWARYLFPKQSPWGMGLVNNSRQ